MYDKSMASHLEAGEKAEQAALKFLQKMGLRAVCSNYRCKFGEIDLIMKDGNILVIVEVRYRKTERYGGALASITRKKQQRIIAATQQYVIINNLLAYPIRFDVVALSGDYSINWIKNAFQT